MADRVFPEKKQITPIGEASWRSRGGKDRAGKGRVQPSPAPAFFPARVHLSLAEVNREVKNVQF
ncbi:MAG: hypothetical protein AB1424_05285 [Thermodesulfobacteriota bacterium]